jgi:hypothetical protein
MSESPVNLKAFARMVADIHEELQRIHEKLQANQSVAKDDPDSPFNVRVFARLVADIREELQREANQSILKSDHAQGLSALGGLDALHRIESRVQMIMQQYRFTANAEKNQPYRKLNISPIRGSHS